MTEFEIELNRIRDALLGFIRDFFRRHPECCGLRTADEVLPTFLAEFKVWCQR